jgi:GNAT superfamily N-acetyltransferase
VKKTRQKTKQLQLADMDAAARVHRISFDHALPWLTGLHTPEEDRWFYRERMLKECTLWGAFDDDRMTGLIAFRDEWIEQLYVLPEAQGRGVGTVLLDVAKRASVRLQLWTFQRNAPARRFYEARGFAVVEQTDGAGNEEQEPDARYLWTRA